MYLQVNFYGILYYLRRKNLLELTKIQIIYLITSALPLKKTTNTWC